MHFWYGGQQGEKVRKSVSKCVENLHNFCKNRRNFTFFGFGQKWPFGLKNHFFAKFADKPLGKTRVPPPPPRCAIEENVFSKNSRKIRIFFGSPGPLGTALLLMCAKKFRTGSGARARIFFVPGNFFFFREKKQSFIFFYAFLLKCPKE